MEDRKSIIDRVLGATDATVTRVQNEVSNREMVTATRERASAVKHRTRTAALNQLHLATRDDVARLQASLDRIEAALNALSKQQQPPRPRTTRAKPAAAAKKAG
jgi:hypothetical protein